MNLAVVADIDEMSGDRRYPVPTEIALLRQEVARLSRLLEGDTREKGLIAEVDELTRVSEHGRWSVKMALWVGGALATLATAAAALKSLFFGVTPPGH